MRKTKTRQPTVFVEKRLLTPSELAASLNVPIWKARHLYRKGVIPKIVLGHRTVRFDLDAVLAALEQHTAQRQANTKTLAAK